jgi:predicted nucleotidyltransferase component of viral defense system
MDEQRYDEHHKAVMRAVIKAIGERDLLLKGGTALLFGYGIDRFSDDLDFDANRPVRDIERKISRIALNDQNITVLRVDTLKNTDTVGRYRVQYTAPSGTHSLKVEISYQVASIRRLIDQKLLAAFDGERPRTKARDLYDLEFLSKNYPEEFTEDLARRFRDFTADPERLFSIYLPAFQEDDLVFHTDAEIEEMVLGLHDAAEQIQQRFGRRSHVL